MSLLKTFFGAIVGGAIACFLQTKLSGVWPVLLVGLLAGIGGRIASGANRSFSTGAIAATAAILAFCGASFLNSLAIINSYEDPSKPALTQADIDKLIAEDDSEDEETETAQGVEAVEPPPEVPEVVGEIPTAIPTDSYDTSTMELALNILSPLLAFGLASGTRQKSLEHVAMQEPPSDQPIG